MDVLLGLLIIAIGSFGQSSSYVPIKKIKSWEWENFWLVQGIFAWLVFPLLGALLAVPEGGSLFSLLSSGGALMSIIYGVLWGVGGLTFGLSMRYLGVALGQSISLGTCSAFGTLFPALMAGTDLFHGEGLVLLLGVCITLAGIAVIGYSGSLRSRSMSEEEKKAAVKDFALTKGLLVALLARSMSEEEKKAAVKDFALTKGLLVALLAGVMSACFALGLDAGSPIKEAALSANVNPLYAGLPVILLVTFGGFLTNAAYCFWQNIKNGTTKDYFKVSPSLFINNVLFCMLAGVLWYSQFFGLEMGKSFFTDNAVLMAFAWSILMSLNVVFSNLWGIILREWAGADRKTLVTLGIGLLILIFSIFFPSLV